TQPNKLYRNLKNGKFQEVAVRAGVAFSEDGKARGGMGVDAGDLDNSGIPSLAVTNFYNEMLALYRGTGGDCSRIPLPVRRSGGRRVEVLGSVASSSMQTWTDCWTYW